MTTATLDGRETAAARPTDRTLNVIRLQFINTQTFVWVPLLVFVGAMLCTMVIYWIIDDLAGANVTMIGGGQQAPLWYFLVVGVQAMTLTFPFSQAMSLTRREFFIGSILAAGISAVGMAVIYTVLGLVELATNGYGREWYFAHLPWLWEAGPLAAGAGYALVSLLFFTIGFWFASIYRRAGTMAVAAILIGAVLVLLLVAALLTVNDAWIDVFTAIGSAGPVPLGIGIAVATAALSVGSYFTLRRLPA